MMRKKCLRNSINNITVFKFNQSFWIIRKGKTKTWAPNRRIASLLSFVAEVVKFAFPTFYFFFLGSFCGSF